MTVKAITQEQFNSSLDFMCATHPNMRPDNVVSISNLLSTFGKVKHSSINSVDIFTSVKEKTLYVCFQGSLTVQDWIVNFRFLPKKGTHAGYRSEALKAKRKVNQLICDEIDLHGDLESIIVFGHSNGGGVMNALLSCGAFDMFGEGFQNSKMKYCKLFFMSFGAPCSSTFLLNDKTHRFIAEADIVPHLIRWLPFLKYKHSGRRTIMSGDGSNKCTIDPTMKEQGKAFIRKLRKPWQSVSHHMPSYYAAAFRQWSIEELNNYDMVDDQAF